MLFDTAQEMYHAIIENVLRHGATSSPRGHKTYEVLGARLSLRDGRRNLIANPYRGLNYYFQVAEWLWMLLGHNDVSTISRYNSRIAEFSDDGVTFRGAYGPKLTEQLPYVLAKLKSDSDSRQAIITLWRENPASSRDVPCTVAFQFMLRNDAVQMITFMRSNDVWLGLPYDLFNFTRIQGYVAAALDVETGTYTHMVGSLHLYDQHVAAARRVITELISTEPDSLISPRLTYPVPQPVRALFNYLTQIDVWEPLEQADKLLESVDQPWRNYLAVLAYRTLKNTTLPVPWNSLINTYGVGNPTLKEKA